MQVSKESRASSDTAIAEPPVVKTKSAKSKPVKKSAGRKASESIDLVEKLRQTEMLLDISRAVAAMETVDGVLEKLIELTTKETGGQNGALCSSTTRRPVSFIPVSLRAPKPAKSGCSIPVASRATSLRAAKA